MDEKTPEIPSELKSAINIALFQAQQTYVTAMETQFSEYKNMIRQEMLAFMKQIRDAIQNMNSEDPVPAEQPLHSLMEHSTALVSEETAESLVYEWHSEALKAQQVLEPLSLLPSPPSEAARSVLADKEDSRKLESLQKVQTDKQIPQHSDEQITADSPGSSASGCSELWPEPLQNPKTWFGKHARSKKVTNWPILRFCQQWYHTGIQQRFANEADDPQPDGDPGPDPVVKALYRPRAGGGSESGCGIWKERRTIIILPG
ncbi:hypothetical protein ACLKA6_017034 [Drosophila palustris]